MSVYNNLSGTAEFDVEVPYKDTMVYNLKLKDKTTGEYLPFTGSPPTLEVFLGKSIKFKVSATISEDTYTATFKKDTNLAIHIYGYRIRTTANEATTTAVRGKFKVS